MTDSKIDIKPIHLLLKQGGDAGKDVTDHAALQDRFTRMAATIHDAYRQRFGGSTGPADAVGLLAIVGDFLTLMRSLDSQYGTEGTLPVSDAAHAVDEALRSLAELDTWLERLDLSQQHETVQGLVLGIGYWAMCHHLSINAPEPVVNALAIRSNDAQTRQEMAAIYALMQGFIRHLAPQLSADLERSNPERPWRLLNLNFAITSIRTGDMAMMRYAFDTLNAHLPDERSGFYEQALGLASQPGFPVETRALIESECHKASRLH